MSQARVNVRFRIIAFRLIFEPFNENGVVDIIILARMENYSNNGRASIHRTDFVCFYGTF